MSSYPIVLSTIDHGVRAQKIPYQNIYNSQTQIRTRLGLCLFEGRTNSASSEQTRSCTLSASIL